MTEVEDILFAAAVFVLGLGGVLGIAYSLDARRKRHGVFGPRLPPPGHVGRGLRWAARILAALMALSLISAYVFRSEALVWVTAACLLLFFADHVAYWVVRLTGK